MADLNVVIGADISQYQAGMQQAASTAKSVSDRLKADLQTYQALAEKTFDPALLGTYNNQIKNLQSSIARLGKEAEITANDTKDIAKDGVSGLNSLGGATISASMKFQQMRSGISAARDGLMGFAIGGQAGERALMAMGHHINSLVNETGSFSGAMKAMGASLMGPGGIILGLTLAFELFKHFSKEESDAYDATKHFTDAANAQHAVFQNLDSSYGEAVKNVHELTENVKLAKDGFINKNEVVKEYNDTLGKTMGAVKTLDEVEQKLVSGAQDYIKMMLYKAAAQTALKEASDKAVEAAKSQMKSQEELQSIGSKVASFSVGQQTGPGFVPGGDPMAASKQRSDALKAFADKARKEEIDKYQSDSDKLLKIADDFQTKAAQISSSHKWTFIPDQKIAKLKEAVTGLDLLIQKAKEAESAFNDAVANDALKPGSVSESVLTQLAKQAELARMKVNEVKASIAAIKLELSRQENIKEFGVVFPLAKPNAPTSPEITGSDKSALGAAQANLDKQQAKETVGAIVSANAEILSSVQDQYDQGLINIKSYLQQKYFLELSNLNQERSLYAIGTVEYGNYTNRMTNLTKNFDKAIKNANEPTKAYMQTIKELSHVIGSGLMNAFQSALSGTQSFMQALGQFFLQLIEKIVAAAAAALVLAVLLEVTGFGAFTSSFGSLFGQLSGLGSAMAGISSGGGSSSASSNAQGFASGGIFTQTHYGMFAESGPEAIVTPKHLADFAGVSQGKGQETLSMTLKGSDMLLFLNRANKTKSRTS